MMRKLLAAAVFAVALAVPATAASATTYTDRFAGVEVLPVTSTLGTFTGVATGQLPGFWYAQIVHEPLSTGPSVAITGGSFTLHALGGRTVAGAVTGGSVSVLDPGAGCTNQTYAVRAVLGNGGFAGTLTHYRISIFGRCITYSASILGVGTLRA